MLEIIVLDFLRLFKIEKAWYTVYYLWNNETCAASLETGGNGRKLGTLVYQCVYYVLTKSVIFVSVKEKLHIYSFKTISENIYQSVFYLWKVYMCHKNLRGDTVMNISVLVILARHRNLIHRNLSLSFHTILALWLFEKQEK